MKNTKTTIRELSARYRDILKKCFFLNAVAIGLFAATSASAAINVVTDVSGYGVTKNVANIEPAVQSAARTAVQGDLNNTSSAIYNAVKSEAIKEIADNIRNTVYSDGKYDTNNADYRTDSASSLSVTTGTPTADKYQFTLGDTKKTYENNGDGGSINSSNEYVAGNMKTGLISVNSDALTALNDATAADLTGRTGYGTYADQIARNDSQLYTQKTTEGSGYKFQLGATATDDPTVGAALGSTEGLAFFKYTDNHTGTAETVTLKSLLDADKLAEGDNGLLVLNDETHLNKADYTFALSTIDPTKGGRDDTITGKVSDGVDVTKYYYLDDASNKVYFAADTTITDLIGNDAALEVFQNFGADSVAYKGNDGNGGALGQYNTDDTAYRTAIENYNTERAAFNTLVDAYDNADSGYSKALTDAKDAYDTANADYRKADEAFLRDTVAYNKENGEYTAYSSSVQIAVDERADAAITRGLEDDGAITTAIGTAVNGLKTEAETIFAEKQQWVDETLGITSANADAVKAEYTGTNYLANAETLTAADKALDTQIKTNADAIAVLNGNAQTEGSVAKAAADTLAAANEYADNAVATLETGKVLDLENAMGDISQVNTTKNITKAEVVTALNDLDNAIVTKVGDANVTTSSYTATGTTPTLTQHVSAIGSALDASVGTRSEIAGISGSYTASATSGGAGSATAAPTLAAQVQAINDSLEATLGTTEELQAVFGGAGGSAPTNLAGYLNQQAGNAAATQAANEAQFAQLDSKISKLETKMEKGLAANNALAGLVPLDHVHRTQVSAALGGYKDNQALAVGAFHYLNDRTLLNAGAAYGGNDSVSYKVGITFGF